MRNNLQDFFPIRFQRKHSIEQLSQSPSRRPDLLLLDHQEIQLSALRLELTKSYNQFLRNVWTRLDITSRQERIQQSRARAFDILQGLRNSVEMAANQGHMSRALDVFDAREAFSTFES